MDLKEKKTFKRLSSNIVPLLYDVSLQPDLINLTFKGWETISFHVKSSSKSIILNSFDIVVDNVSLCEKDGDKASIPSISYSSEEETVQFHFEQLIEPGDYQLKLDFKGNLNDQLRGFYRNKYTSPDGDVRYAAVTHFEATGARRAYPCWDDPKFKAQFVFTLIAPTDRVALSNMPIDSEKISDNDPDLKIVRFKTTPIMSTYLTAFVVGEYDFVESSTKAGTLIRVYTPKEKSEQGSFSLEIAVKALEYYESYFGVPYGLPKLDLITLADFAIGAMENWGLITYRERALLIDSQKSSAVTRQHVALIVAHELSHNWFGNLVTMDWWTDLWLKEGFATWIEYLCVDSIFPELKIWNYFIDREQHNAFHLDALTNSHPVQVEVRDPCEIDEIFDAISYSKGACLLRMLEFHIGAEIFRKGMNLYLVRHSHGNTQTDDLWSVLTEVSGQDIKSLMDSWTQQTGFPLIKVTEEIDPGSNTRKVKLTQEKFTASSVGSTSLMKPVWVVPYAITTSQSPDKPVLQGVMNDICVDLTIEDCEPNDWIKVNPGQYMFYHVQYSMESLCRMMPAIESQVLSVSDRIGILTDIVALCKSNKMNAVDVFETSRSFRNDKDPSVCSKLGMALTELLPYVEEITNGNLQRYKAFLCDNFRCVGVTWDAIEGEDPRMKILREQTLKLLGCCGEESVKKEAFKRFDDYLKGLYIIPPDLKAPIYAIVLRHGGQEAYDAVLKIYNEEDTMEEKNRIQRLLGMVTEKDILQEILTFSLSEKVRSQDSLYVLSGVAQSLEGRKMVWKFVQENWDELYHRYGTSVMLGTLINIVTDYVCKLETATEIKEFFAHHECKAGARSLLQGLEHIDANVAFVKAQGDAIVEFLKTPSK